MTLTTINIVDEGTLAALKVKQPFAVGFRGRHMVYATDTDTIHRIDEDGNLSGDITGKQFPISALNRGTEASPSTFAVIAGIPASPSFVALFRDGFHMDQSLYTVSAGRITPTDPLEDESLTGWYTI